MIISWWKWFSKLINQERVGKLSGDGVWFCVSSEEFCFRQEHIGMYRKKWMQKLVGWEIGMVVVSCGSSNCFWGIEVQANLFESQRTRWPELNAWFHTSDCHVNVKMVAYEDCQSSRKQASLCSEHRANYLDMAISIGYLPLPYKSAQIPSFLVRTSIKISLLLFFIITFCLVLQTRQP